MKINKYILITLMLTVLQIDSNKNNETNTQNSKAGKKVIVNGIDESIVLGAGVYVNCEGQLGIISSCERNIENISDIADESSFILSLRPVKFNYINSIDPLAKKQYGLVAEDVAHISNDLVMYNNQGQALTVKYQFLSTLLLNEFQKIMRVTARLSAQNDRLSKSVAQLESRLKILESKK